MDTIRATRFPELGYREDGPGLWRIYDRDGDAPVGPHYKSKAELFGDLERYATFFGCNPNGLSAERTALHLAHAALYECAKANVPSHAFWNRGGDGFDAMAAIALATARPS